MIREEIQAQVIMEIARQSPHAGHDKNRAFISDVYDTMVSQGLDEGLSLADFKKIVLTLTKKGLLLTTRADLVGAFSKQKLSRSMIDLLPRKDGLGGVERHFIVVNHSQK